MQALTTVTLICGPGPASRRTCSRLWHACMGFQLVCLLCLSQTAYSGVSQHLLSPHNAYNVLRILQSGGLVPLQVASLRHTLHQPHAPK